MKWLLQQCARGIRLKGISMGWKVVAVILLVVLGLWWTRYEVLHAVQGYTLVRDRFTNQLWNISPDGGRKINWEERVIEKETSR